MLMYKIGESLHSLGCDLEVMQACSAYDHDADDALMEDLPDPTPHLRLDEPASLPKVLSQSYKIHGVHYIGERGYKGEKRNVCLQKSARGGFHTKTELMYISLSSTLSPKEVLPWCVLS